MRNSLKTRITALFSICLLLFATVLPVSGALHPLSTLQHNSTTGISDIDVTISLDWNPDTVNQSVMPRGMTKTEMETAVKEYAASLFAMTNGLHRLRNVYIHSNKRSWANADIRFVGTKHGRSSANIAAWQVPNQQITMYVYESMTETDQYPGPVMAHESGHYIYGLLDEYTETGAEAKTIKQLLADSESYMPSGEDDGTQPSIMNQHASYPNWLSTAESYAGSVLKQNTAQYRIYGKSIWDTLTSDPANDPEYARSFGRMKFDAFVGKQVKTAANLKANQTGKLSGYDTALNIVWVNAPILNLVLLDSNTAATRWSGVQEGASTLAQNSPVDNYLQIMSGSSVMMGRTMVTDSNKNTLAAQAKTVRQGAAVPLATALNAALEQVKAYRSTLKNPQASVISLLAGSNQPVPASLLTALRQNNVSLRVFYDSSAATASKASVRPKPKLIKASDVTLPNDEQIYLSQLSQATGGSFTIVSSAAELEQEAAAAAQELEGAGFAVINQSVSTALAAGKTYSMQFTVGKYDPQPIIMMEASKETFAKLTPGLIDPTGKKITGEAPGITLIEDSESGSWLWLIDPDLYAGATGTWTATLTAKEAVTTELGMMAANISDLQLQMDVVQRPVLGNLLEVSLKLDRPVLQAQVRADIYDEQGKLVRSGLTLTDNGKNGDLRPSDGVYTVALNDLPVGEYSFRVTANDNNGSAITSDRGTLFNPRKAAVKDETTGPFQRTDEETFVVTALPSSSDGGGGCTIGTGKSADLLLLLTLIFPALYLAWPVQRASRKRS